MFTTDLPAKEITMYVITAPMNARLQQVDGDRQQTEPTTAMTKKISTAKVAAIDRIVVFIFQCPQDGPYSRFIPLPADFARIEDARSLLAL